MVGALSRCHGCFVTVVGGNDGSVIIIIGVMGDNTVVIWCAVVVMIDVVCVGQYHCHSVIYFLV